MAAVERTTPISARATEPSPELIARVVQGEKAACRLLLVRYEGPIFALLGRMLRPAGLGSLVEDLAQETFLRVFKSIAQYDPSRGARLSTWIFTIATRLAINELNRVRPIVDPVDGSLAIADHRVLDAEHEARRRVHAILHAVARMTPEYRAALVLHAFHECSYQEIAQILDLKEGTVKSRLSRAREWLRQATEESEHG